jgi:hypothetical protein
MGDSLEATAVLFCWSPFFISSVSLSFPLFFKELKRGGGEDGGQPGGYGRPPRRGPGPRREGRRLHQVNTIACKNRYPTYDE